MEKVEMMVTDTFGEYLSLNLYDEDDDPSI